MTTFLSDERREHLIEGLTTIGMPQEMAEEFASWSDNPAEVDARLTAMANQAAHYRDKADAGDKSVMKFLLTSVIILVDYMNEVEQRGWNEEQLPLMNAALNGHNQRWRQQTTLQ